MHNFQAGDKATWTNTGDVIELDGKPIPHKHGPIWGGMIVEGPHKGLYVLSVPEAQLLPVSK